MISIKNKKQIEAMKKAGYIVALVHSKMKEVVKPGITTNQLDKIAYDIIVENKATPSFLNYHGFPKTICASVNNTIVHGIPNDIPLKDGDIISIDVGAKIDGCHGDSAWTYAVGEISQEDKKLMAVAHQSLMEGLKMVKDGVHLGDVSATIGNYVFKHGYSVPELFTGHGIGENLHEDPVVHNHGEFNTGIILKKGMGLAIEPMVHAGKKHVTILNDGWTANTKDNSRVAHYEHTIIVTEQGCQIMTSLDQKEIING